MTDTTAPSVPPAKPKGKTFATWLGSQTWQKAFSPQRTSPAFNPDARVLLDTTPTVHQLAQAASPIEARFVLQDKSGFLVCAMQYAPTGQTLELRPPDYQVLGSVTSCSLLTIAQKNALRAAVAGKLCFCDRQRFWMNAYDLIQSQRSFVPFSIPWETEVLYEGNDLVDENTFADPLFRKAVIRLPGGQLYAMSTGVISDTSPVKSIPWLVDGRDLDDLEGKKIIKPFEKDAILSVMLMVDSEDITDEPL